MMGGSKSTDSILLDNNPYPSLDITLGSMEPSFIVWEDDKEAATTATTVATSLQDMGHSLMRDYSNVTENMSLSRKVPLDNENHDYMLGRLSLKEHERVSMGWVYFFQHGD
jgi:hypothetical protein